MSRLAAIAFGIAERLVAIADRFQASYIVLDKAQNTSRLGAQIAYEDGFNVVYALAH